MDIAPTLLDVLVYKSIELKMLGRSGMGGGQLDKGSANDSVRESQLPPLPRAGRRIYGSPSLSYPKGCLPE